MQIEGSPARVSGRRLEVVDLLRGLAAFAVMWFHLTRGHASGAQELGDLGWLGVDCFFVISGFVIPLSLHGKGYRTSDFWRFLARRLTRLEPPYVASIALTLVLATLSTMAPGFNGQPVEYGVGQVLSHLLYLAPVTGHEWISPVYWTLAYEFVFYLVVGLTFSFLAKRSILWTAAVAALFVLGRYLQKGELDPRIIEFVIGIAAMRFYVGRDRLPVFLATLAACVGLVLVDGFGVMGAVAGITALCLVFVRTPHVPLLSGLGTISYSLYLVHVPIGGRVVNLGRRFGEGLVFEVGLSIIAAAVSLIAAWVFYVGVEAIALRWSRSIPSVRARSRVTNAALAEPELASGDVPPDIPVTIPAEPGVP